MGENSNDFNAKAVIIIFMLSLSFLFGKSYGESKYYNYRNEISESVSDQQNQIDNLYDINEKVQNLYLCTDEDRFDIMSSDDKVGYIVPEDVYDSICAYENSIGTKNELHLKKEMLSDIDDYTYDKNRDYVNFTDIFTRLDDIDINNQYNSEEYIDILQKNVDKISND